MNSATLAHSSVEQSNELERSAFNAAFYELGLRWYWDGDTYRALSRAGDERACLRRYIHTEQEHLLRAYDAEFLIDAVLQAKQRAMLMLRNATPQGGMRCAWADARWGEVGA